MNIIICGPKWRNDRIAIYLRQRGHTVMMDNERQILSDLDNGLTADLIISNGFAPYSSLIMLRNIISLTSTQRVCPTDEASIQTSGPYTTALR